MLLAQADRNRGVTAGRVALGFQKRPGGPLLAASVPIESPKQLLLCEKSSTGFYKEHRVFFGARFRFPALFHRPHKGAWQHPQIPSQCQPSPFHSSVSVYLGREFVSCLLHWRPSSRLLLWLCPLLSSVFGDQRLSLLLEPSRRGGVEERGLHLSRAPVLHLFSR